VISDLNRLSATEPFPSIGFQIINEVSLTDDSPCHWTRTNECLIVGLVSAPFLKNHMLVYSFWCGDLMPSSVSTTPRTFRLATPNRIYKATIWFEW